MTYHAYECDDPVFDLCMDVVLDGKKKTYYSMWDWEVGSLEEMNTVSLDTPE